MAEDPGLSVLDGDLDNCFGFLNDAERKEIGSYLQLKSCAAKETLMKENETSNYLAFLSQGRLAVKKETDFQGKYIILAMLEQGTVVGETEILGHGPRSTTVVAVEDCRLLTLTDESFNRLLNDNPALGIKLLKRIIYIMSLRLRKAGERLSQLL